jgi:acetyltransferase
MFEQAGALEAESSHDAAVMSKALSMAPLPKSNRLAIMTFTAGPSIVAMDRVVEAGWNLAPLSDNLRGKVRRIIGEKTPVDLQNPLDLTGPGFIPQTYGAVMEQVLNEDFDAYLFIWGINPLIRTPVVEWKILKDRHPDKSLVFVLIAHAEEGIPLLREMNRLGLCCYLTPEDGALALNTLLRRKTLKERQVMQ